MSNRLYYIKNKLPDLSYVFTLNGIELPVLDITHPEFISSIDENKLKKMLSYVGKNAEKNANKFNRMPAFIKKYFAKHSFAMAELLENESSFASGISTLMMKLGPNLIGKGKKRFWDRQVTKGFGSLVIRMRMRDISLCQANALIPLLQKSQERNLCFTNIAGGSASDSINALFLIRQKNAGLLKNRKIEINVLDIDTFGPSFADRCITALKSPGGSFNDLNISFRYIHYDWNSTDKLENLLNERKEWLQICSSEGGLFEYCSDEVIIQNLEIIYNNSTDDIIIVGSLLHDIKTVDAGIKAALKISTVIKPRFLGIDGLKNIIEKNKWNLNNMIEGNPRYLIFALSKDLEKKFIN
jgi:hypothetical protein